MQAAQAKVGLHPCWSSSMIFLYWKCSSNLLGFFNTNEGETVKFAHHIASIQVKSW